MATAPQHICCLCMFMRGIVCKCNYGGGMDLSSKVTVLRFTRSRTIILNRNESLTASKSDHSSPSIALNRPEFSDFSQASSSTSALHPSTQFASKRASRLSAREWKLIFHDHQSVYGCSEYSKRTIQSPRGRVDKSRPRSEPPSRQNQKIGSE